MTAAAYRSIFLHVRWPVVFLALIFLLPIAAAAIMLGYSQNLPPVTEVYGKILQSQRHVAISLVYDLHMNPIRDFVVNKWTIIYVLPTTHKPEYWTHLQKLQKLHTALGAEKDRVAIITANYKDISPIATADSIMILNSHSYHVMQYDMPVEYSYVLKDLRRLLKYSHAH